MNSKRFGGLPLACLIACLLACLLSLTPFLTTSARAEGYLAGQVGVTFPNDLTDQEGIQAPLGVDLSGLRFSDAELSNSLEWGVKAGYFLNSLKWLGVETEFFYTNPHLKQQNITTTGTLLGAPVPPGTVANIGGAHVRVATLAFNLIARYPGERFQPYAGVGLGINWARVSGNDNGPGTASDTSPGLNALAGVRYLITPHVGLFTEYKYNRATFDFGGGGDPACVGGTCVYTKADYSAHHIVFGVGYHF